MDGFEFNKIAGAVLATLLAVMTLGVVAETVYHDPRPEQPGYVIAVAEPTEGTGGEAEAPQIEPIANRLASADPAAGESATRPCVACHTFQQGEPNKVGPNLYGTVGATIGHIDGYAYSSKFQELHGAGETWSYDNLDHFLANPRGFAQGTKMTYAGIKDDQQRANVIAYLRSLSPNAPPVPAPVAAAEEGAPAEGEAPADGAAAPTDGAAAPADGAAAPADAPATTEGAAPAGDAPAAPDAPAAQDAPAQTTPAAPADGAAPAAAPEAPAPQQASPESTAPAQAPASQPGSGAPASGSVTGGAAPGASTESGSQVPSSGTPPEGTNAPAGDTPAQTQPQAAP